MQPTGRRPCGRRGRPWAIQARARWLAEESCSKLSIGGLEGLLGLVESALLHERAAEDELRRADLVEEVDAPLEERQRLAREPLGLLEVVQLEMDGGERAGRLGGLLLAVGVERGRVRGLQVLDRLAPACRA